jgi:hypothetical protein
VDYPTLFATVKAYVENDFPDTIGVLPLSSTDQVDTFIQQAEGRIYNSVQLLDLRKNSTGYCTTGNQYLTMPADWIATFSLALVDPSTGKYVYLLNKDVNYLREAFPDPNAVSQPTHYAFFDDTAFILAPTPDATYEMELHYFFYPETIVTAGTTWLGDHFDSALLYGALLEAYTFMKGEADILQQYRSRYDEAMSLLKQLGDGKTRQDAYRAGQVRYPVK